MKNISGWSISHYSKNNWLIFLHFKTLSALQTLRGRNLFELFIKLLKFLTMER